MKRRVPEGGFAEKVAGLLRCGIRFGEKPDGQAGARVGTGRLLGGQAVGRTGADKRTGVVATALYAGLAVEDLTRLDPEYAPPFNGVWDPAQVAAASLLGQGF